MKLNTSSSFINRSSRSEHASKGFTLVELLVVIAIIAILSGIIIASLTSSKAKSRDAQRVSDLNQIQLAIEQYFSRCGQYPTALVTTIDNGCSGTGITLVSFISVIPNDPSTGKPYDYVVNNRTTPTDYVLHALLESSNSVLKNSLPESVRSSTNPTDNSWMNWGNNSSCYTGAATSLDYCISTK